MAGIVSRWWGSPPVRRRIARVVVVIGIGLGLFGLFTQRYALLLAGILVVGFGAAMGPARIRRATTEEGDS